MGYIVNTPCGEIKGVKSNVDGVIAFKGIRYAFANRFEYPKEVTSWEGVYDASEYGHCCYQPRSFYNEEENVKKQFDEKIGFGRVKVIHLNDSKNPFASHKDRHANLGDGYIGFETLYRVCHDEDFKLIPKILETPYIDGVAPYKEEIARLRG